MGYRSDVVIAVSTERLEKGYEKYGTLKKFFEGADKHFVSGETSYFQFLSIKWYDSFEEIAECDAFLQEIEDEANVLSALGSYTDPEFQFMRQGEDSDDFEHRGSWNYDYIEHGLSLGNPDIKSYHKDTILGFLEKLVPADRLEEAKQMFLIGGLK